MSRTIINIIFNPLNQTSLRSSPINIIFNPLDQAWFGFLNYFFLYMNFNFNELQIRKFDGINA